MLVNKDALDGSSTVLMRFDIGEEVLIPFDQPQLLPDGNYENVQVSEQVREEVEIKRITNDEVLDVPVFPTEWNTMVIASAEERVVVTKRF